MKKPIDGSRMILSWLLAWNMRCCPPDSVLAETSCPELEQHLLFCPLCRRDRKNVLPQIQLDLPGKDAAARKMPQIGELWSLAGSLGGWGPKFRYYSPPVVLVTGLTENKAVNVVQIFGDVNLAGPDDILLDNELIGFAEPWNRYTVQLCELETHLGAVTDACILRLGKAMEDSPSSVSQGSLLWFFRQMEVETGWFFSRQSMTDLLESSRTRISLVSRYTLLEDLQNLPLVLPEISPDDPPETILARTMPSDDLLPLAAAGMESGAVRILLFVANEGRIQQVKTVPATITLHSMEEGLIRISGYYDPEWEEPDDESEWIFRWQSSKWSIEPLPGHFGTEDGVFWVVFPIDTIADATLGELIIRALISD